MDATPRQRIEAAIALRASDRVPVMPLSASWPVRLIGATHHRFYTEPETMAAATVEAARRMGWDAVQCGAGVGRLHPFRADAVSYAEDDDPQWRRPVIEEPSELDRLAVPDFAGDPYAGTPLRAIGLIRAALGPDFTIWMGVDSPWQFACLLRGVQELLVDTIDRPAFVDEIVAFACEAMADLARQAIAAGAHVYLMDAMASANQISPATYRRWPQPYERKMAELAHSLGAYQMLHVCGNTTRILEGMADTGSDVVDLDSAVAMAEAKRRIGYRVCLKGNVDPVGGLLQGTPRQIEDECLAILADAAAGGGLILGPGCQIPRDAPEENVLAMARAVQRFGDRGSA